MCGIKRTFKFSIILYTYDFLNRNMLPQITEKTLKQFQGDVLIQLFFLGSLPDFQKFFIGKNLKFRSKVEFDRRIFLLRHL